MQGLFLQQLDFVVQRRDIRLQRHDTELKNARYSHSIVAYMLKVGSAWTDITRLCELQELLKPFSFNNRSRMTIHKNEISNSIGDGKGRRSSKSPLFQQLIRRGRSSFLLLHRAKKPIKAIDLHFLNQLGVTIFFLLSLFSSKSLFLRNPFGDTRKISMFRFSMISKWVRATKIICPVTFDALHMVFASAGELDVMSKETNPTSRLHNRISPDNHHDLYTWSQSEMRKTRKEEREEGKHICLVGRTGRKGKTEENVCATSCRQSFSVASRLDCSVAIVWHKSVDA